jgi:hypothetical protein
VRVPECHATVIILTTYPTADVRDMANQLMEKLLPRGSDQAVVGVRNATGPFQR